MENGGREVSRAKSFDTPRMSLDESWEAKYQTASPALLSRFRLQSLRRKQKEKDPEDPANPAVDDLICLDSFDEIHEDTTPRVEVTRDVLRTAITDQLRAVCSQIDVFNDVDLERLSSFNSWSLLEKNVALLAAALLNKYQVFDKLLALGADLNFNESKFSFSALHIASFCGSTNFVERILKKTSSLNLTTGVYSPLHLAALGGHSEIIQRLLEAGAGIDRLHQAGETALGCAVRSQNTQCVKTLVDAGADVNVLDAYGYTPLHLATDFGSSSIVKILLESDRCLIDAFTRSENNTALHLAAANGTSELVELLLGCGASPDVRNARLKTPLHFSSRTCPECTDLLLQRRGDPNAMDVDKRTPLHAAVARSEVRFGAEIVRLLLKWRANVNAQDRYGYTALHIAALNELADCAEVLVTNGADVTVRTKGGTAALGLVARKTPSALNAVRQHLDTYITCNDPEVSYREVQLKFNFKYLLQGCQRGEMNFLRTAIEEGQRNILEHPLCEAFLHLKWQKIRFYYLARLIFCFIFICLLSTYVLVALAYQCYEKPPEPVLATKFAFSPAPKITFNASLCANKSSMGVWLRENPAVIENEWLILAIFTVLEILRKLYGINSYKSIRQYCNLSNIVEWFVVASVLATSYALFSGPWQNHVGAFAVLVGWANLMVMIGNLPVFGAYVAMYTSVQKQFAKLLSAYICLLIGFTISFCAIFVKADAFENPLIGFVKILVMMTGEFDFGNLLEDINREGGSSANILEISALIIFVMFLLFVTIILINLLIGIAVHDIQGLQKTAGLSKLVGLTNLIFHIEAALFGPRVPNCFVRLLNSTSGVPSLVTVSPLSARESRLPREIVRAGWEIVKCSRGKGSGIERRKTFSIKRSENVPETDLGELLDIVLRLSQDMKELKAMVADKKRI